ncbi:ankyrin repeat-containing domain protein, partial [Sporodiniella umbellata]
NPNKRDKAGRTKLFYFTSQGNLDKVQEWVQDGAEVSAKDNAGWTVLHEAALKGQDGIMRFLIACGADVNARGFGGDTPLHDACSNGEMACIRSLLENGADVFALNEAEERPVDVCEDRQCRWLLLDRMKQLEQDLACQLGRRSLLHQACLDGCEQATRRCLEQGADVNGKDEKAWTPLHLACAGGKGAIVKILVEQGGALVNILGSDAMDSPLHQASKEGHTDLVRYLLKIRTLDIYLKNRQGLTAYDVCAHYPAIRQLLTARMDELRLLQTTSHALDPIAQKTAHRNASRQQLSREERKIQHVMRVFANLEEEPEKLTVRRRPRRRPISHSPPKPTDPLRGLKKDASGRTELHRAASAGNGDKLHTLLARGVDPNPRDHAGYSPLHEASLRGHTRAVRLLLEHGADVHAQGGPDEDTALHDATENGHGAVIQLLLDHGAHPLQTNRQGKHPLHLAL